MSLKFLSARTLQLVYLELQIFCSLLQLGFLQGWVAMSVATKLQQSAELFIWLYLYLIHNAHVHLCSHTF